MSFAKSHGVATPATPLLCKFVLELGLARRSRQFARFGLRPIMIVGSILIPAGTCLLVLLTPSSSAILAGAGSLIMGFGMGLLNIGVLVLTQESVNWSERGSATASNVFSRNLGSTLGAAILGAVLAYGLANSTDGQSITAEQLRALLNGTGVMMPDAESIRLALPRAAFHFHRHAGVRRVDCAGCFFVPKPQVGSEVPQRT